MDVHKFESKSQWDSIQNILTQERQIQIIAYRRSAAKRFILVAIDSDGFFVCPTLKLAYNSTKSLPMKSACRVFHLRS